MIRSALRRLLGRDTAPREETEDVIFRRLVEQSSDVICRVVDGQFRYVSPSAFNTFGWDPKKLVGTSGLHIIYEDDWNVVETAIGRLASGQQRQSVQARTICGDGSLKWIETTAHVETSDSCSEVILVMRDITDRKKLEEELAAFALQDGLTGLANRRGFDQVLDREWKQTLRKNDEMALILLDIDFFKQFNDLYGHQAGDDCLRKVADCVRELARRPTDLACRYGGEEIVVILGSTNLNSAILIANNMRSSVAALKIPHRGSACAENITVSIGVAAAKSGIDGTLRMPEALLHAADQALYKAKAGGRNCVDQCGLIAPS
jgi:diguanylate cyclase (GGDEF)-like protein/PAS domain S-box-containing protein